MKYLFVFLSILVSATAIAQSDITKRLQQADSTINAIRAQRKSDSLRKATVILKLDKWIDEVGKDNPEVECVLRSLRISMWLNKEYYFSLKCGDMAEQLIDGYLKDQDLPQAIIDQYFPKKDPKQ